MPVLFQIAQVFSISSFLFYGVTCLVSSRMKHEFQRYRLSQFRALTGILQIAGSLGLMIGYAYPPLTLVASLGLSILMTLGVLVRIKIRDPWYMAIPAFSYAALNLFIFLQECSLNRSFS